jgi:hypothetical protein
MRTPNSEIPSAFMVAKTRCAQASASEGDKVGRDRAGMGPEFICHFLRGRAVLEPKRLIAAPVPPKAKRRATHSRRRKGKLLLKGAVPALIRFTGAPKSTAAVIRVGGSV